MGLWYGSGKMFQVAQMSNFDFLENPMKNRDVDQVVQLDQRFEWWFLIIQGHEGRAIVVHDFGGNANDRPFRPLLIEMTGDPAR